MWEGGQGIAAVEHLMQRPCGRREWDSLRNRKGASVAANWYRRGPSEVEDTGGDTSQGLLFLPVIRESIGGFSTKET